MPGKFMDAAQFCRRCKDSTAVLVVRKEPLCRDCFVKYVNSKAIKRLTNFHVQYPAPAEEQERKFLVPISLGVSSVTMLHVLDTHLNSQISKTGRTGYSLIVLFVDTSSVEQSAPNPELLAKVQERYPLHQYATLPLQDVFRVVPSDDALFDLIPGPKTDQDTPTLEHLSKLMNSLSSATARADVIPTLRTRLVVEEAKRLGCEGVLWGDSTTKLAEKTLSETCKGRGFSLPWQTADGESPFGISFNYPMRELLKKELFSYVDLVDPPLSALVHESSGPTQASTSSKNTTIDDLMKQYFESVEENFPSIVANVVRTGDRLKAKPTTAEDPRCSLCKMPVADGRFGIHGWGGDQQDGLEELTSEETQGLCYGCTRSIPRTVTQVNGTS